MPIIETSIIIDQDPELVWEVLTDFESYPKWNPFFLNMGTLTSSNLFKGQCFVEKIRMPGGIPGFFPMRVTKLNNLETLEISMSASALNSLLFDRHCFQLKELNGKTEFTHIYEYTGLIFKTVLSFGFVKRATIAIHESMNKELAKQIQLDSHAA